MLWLNGGPGCSSLYGLLTQWGPKVLKADGSLTDNLANLNEKFHLIFLDNPVRTGWSYTKAGGQDWVTRSDTAAEDMFQFLLAFKDQNFDGRNFRANRLHIAGESFAGHYIPSLARRIAAGDEEERDKIGLRTLLIGNGWIDQVTQLDATYDYVCNKGLTADAAKSYVLSDQQCADWKKTLDGQCRSVIERCRKLNSNCEAVSTLCSQCSAVKFWQVSEHVLFCLCLRCPRLNCS